MESFIHLRKGKTPAGCMLTSTGSRMTNWAAAASRGGPRICTGATTPPRTDRSGPLRPIDAMCW